MTCSISDKVFQDETLLMAMNFINEDIRMSIDVAGTMVNYGKLSVITQNEMVISVTLNITNVEY